MRRNERPGVCHQIYRTFRFCPAFVADERLKMNRFEAELNPNIKERMSVHHYTSYMNLYDTTVNVERAMKDRNNYFNEQRGIKRKGDKRENFHSQEPYKRPPENHYFNNNMCGGQHPNTRPRVTCNGCGYPRHYAQEHYLIKRCFCCGSPQHQIRDCSHPSCWPRSWGTGTVAPAALPKQGWADGKPKSSGPNTLAESSSISQPTIVKH